MNCPPPLRGENRSFHSIRGPAGTAVEPSKLSYTDQFVSWTSENFKFWLNSLNSSLALEDTSGIKKV